MSRSNKPAKMHMGVKGKFKLQVYGPDKELRREVEFGNLIVTSGLRALYSDFLEPNNSTSAMRVCRVGSGSSSPAPGQTALDNQVAVTADATPASISLDIHVYDAQNPQDYHVDMEVVYQFGEGVAAGNLSEIGVGFRDATNSGDLFCRALILDGLGNPTTITVLSDEFLVVTYTFSRYPYVNGAVAGTVDGYDYEIHPVGANGSNWNGSSTRFSLLSNGVIQSPPFISAAPLADPFDITSSSTTGTSVNTEYTTTNQNYSDTNHTVIKRLSFSPIQGNQLSPGGIRVMRLRNLWGSTNTGGAWAIEFTPAIDKNENRSLNIDFLLSWGNL